MQLDPGHPMYRALNPHIMGYPGGAPPPGSFLTPSQLGFRLPTEFDGKAMAGEGKGMVPLPVPGASASDGPLDGKNAPGAQGLGGRSTTPLHKIHELQEKGRHPSPGVNSPVPLGKSSVVDVGKGGDSSLPSSASTPGPHDKGSTFSSSGSNNNNNNNGGGSGSGGGKDKQREYASSPPPQRHVHTHHHTHVVGGFPPLYPPDAYSAHPPSAFTHPVFTTQPSGPSDFPLAMNRPVQGVPGRLACPMSPAAAAKWRGEECGKLMWEKGDE
ncbi:hypothetical protein EGW08_009137 [Elysia chlorotica]|uniref:Uncharacterized protein n=1 Tax=Elysia chlorotica TaxID=188477 RepID=A0A3S0ZUH6_ELYCH|nr:hypothetical protein EGW08_009137 [Elysia chlorotica]